MNSHMSETFQANRERLLDELRRREAALVVFTNTPKTRNGDSEYRFRPGSDFWWATGFREPGACLVLVPGRAAGESVVFVRQRNPLEETWTGRRVGVERAAAHLGVAEARPIEKLFDDLPGLLEGHESVFFTTGEDALRDQRMQDVLGRTRLASKRGKRAPIEWSNAAALIGELRLFKTPGELEFMRKAAALTAEAHRGAMALARAGMNEAEIDAHLLQAFRRSGGTGEAYGNIVAGGDNAVILHYHENDMELRSGQLLLVDAGGEYAHYAADITRTFPIDGRFTPDQRALYEVVLTAEKEAIAAVRPGVRFDLIHETAVRALCRGLLELGVLEGSLDEVIEKKSYDRVYMHKTSHWLGIDVHDTGRYFDAAGNPRTLAPGMVLTVEPGVYIAPDDEKSPVRWRGMGIRIEDDVLVTANGHEVLTIEAPKDVADVEAACSSWVDTCP
jgi:Xaa-Pro aminopeptidase